METTKEDIEEVILSLGDIIIKDTKRIKILTNTVESFKEYLEKNNKLDKKQIKDREQIISAINTLIKKAKEI